MKIIIIEGPDNTGKSTLINYILDTYNIVKVIHCDKPKSKNPFAEQCNIFGKFVLDTIKEYNEINDVDCIVFNRFYQGEYVYGQMYRNGNPESIKQMVSILEKSLINNIDKEDLIYIQLMGDPIFLSQNDDGKSLSDGKTKLIKEEIDKFKDIFDYSVIDKKHILFINKYNYSVPEFRDRQDIIDELKKYINN